MASPPEISVVLPVRNEGDAVAPTIQSIARARSTGVRLEFVIVDDASSDACMAKLITVVPQLLEEPKIDIRVCRLDEHSGIYRARNAGAAAATADLLVMTDAHVRFSQGWDEVVLSRTKPNSVLAGVTTQEDSEFRGYGCRLVVPFMGTAWNEDTPGDLSPVQIASCHSTVIPRSLFARLGGYDEGMLFYGAGEPEFSLRAWLHGADVFLAQELEVQHRFKASDEAQNFMTEMRPYSVHNRIRFGLLYLSEEGCMQLLRYYARGYPAFFQNSMRMIAADHVWERRQELEQQRKRSFDWFVDAFELRDQMGGEII